MTGDVPAPHEVDYVGEVIAAVAKHAEDLRGSAHRPAAVAPPFRAHLEPLAS
ncbi:MAG: hypothetical protein ACRDZ4_14220 [Egibacteraceae bacterium]